MPAISAGRATGPCRTLCNIRGSHTELVKVPRPLVKRDSAGWPARAGGAGNARDAAGNSRDAAGKSLVTPSAAPLLRHPSLVTDDAVTVVISSPVVSSGFTAVTRVSGVPQ